MGRWLGTFPKVSPASSVRGAIVSTELQPTKVTSEANPLEQFSVQPLWHCSSPLSSVLPSGAASLPLNPTSYGPSTYSHNYLLSFLPMSPTTVSLQVSLVKRSHSTTGTRYRMQAPDLYSAPFPPIFLHASRHQNQCLAA
ncbi:unnamed protein product [Protopolystoma xenopodis]|uniref:Uncharacterized protein n=1 Tax=Protopolystoma xenopodis TaxID=117903 RepID=A0A448XI74_9PLAT|nr:unnamed protein product [Protopolystoma xenopodis]